MQEPIDIDDLFFIQSQKSKAREKGALTAASFPPLHPSKGGENILAKGAMLG